MRKCITSYNFLVRAAFSLFPSLLSGILHKKKYSFSNI